MEGTQVAFKRGVFWTIEQPTNSVMFKHTRLRKLIEKTGATSIDFPMGAYGAATPKPTTFVGTAPWLHASHPAR